MNHPLVTILERSIIYDAECQPANLRVSFCTSLMRTCSGEIFCAFQVGPVKNAADSTIGIYSSVDGGKGWVERPFPFETHYRGVAGSLGCAEMVEDGRGRLLLFATWWDRSDPQRPLFDPDTQGILHSRTLWCASTDGGKSWDGWREVPLEGMKGCSLTGPVLRWPNGSMAIPFESFKEYDETDPHPHAAWLVMFDPDGDCFSRPSMVARHAEDRVYYWDQRLSAGKKTGEYTAFFWAHDLTAKRDLAVCMKRGSIPSSEKPWESIRETPIRGQIAAPCWLEDGRLLVFVVDRNPPAAMKLWVSPDGGMTWPKTESLVVYHHEEKASVTQGATDVDFRQYWEDMGKWSFGHPAIQPLGNDEILVAYYAGRPDCMSIHSARIQLNTTKQIL